MVPLLPNELIYYILGFVAADTLVDFEAREDISACMLVSRNFRDNGRPHQWRNLNITMVCDRRVLTTKYGPFGENLLEGTGPNLDGEDGENGEYLLPQYEPDFGWHKAPETAENVVEFFRPSPRLGAYVQNLVLSSRDFRMHSYVSLTGAKSLCRILDCFPHLRSLYMKSISLAFRCDDDPHIWRLLSPPKLDLLELDYGWAESSVPQPITDILSVLMFFREVDKVVIGEFACGVGATNPLPELEILCRTRHLCVCRLEPRVLRLLMDNLEKAGLPIGLHTLELGKIGDEDLASLTGLLRQRGSHLKHLVLHLSSTFALGDHGEFACIFKPGTSDIPLVLSVFLPNVFQNLHALEELQLRFSFDLGDVPPEDDEWRFVHRLARRLQPTDNAQLHRMENEHERLSTRQICVVYRFVL